MIHIVIIKIIFLKEVVSIFTLRINESFVKILDHGSLVFFVTNPILIVVNVGVEAS